MTQAAVHLWPEENRFLDTYTEVRATIELPGAGRRLLWYRIPPECGGDVSESCDPFVIAVVFLAMGKAVPVYAHGSVSPSLLSNLEEFMSAWRSWRPTRYQSVCIGADIEREQAVSSCDRRAISAFSGGVDSCFTAYRHAKRSCGRRRQNLHACMMVHGFDIPIHDGASFEQAFTRSKKITDSLGLELVSIVTNFRSIIELPWLDVFGAGIASCLHLLSNTYSVGIIPSSYTYRTATFPYGSNAITDPLLSSDALQVLYDGAAVNRFEKVREMLDWPEATENLRVCWEGPMTGRNCCQCEKCIRNILIFRALGHGLPLCFEEDASNERIARLRVSGAALDALKSVRNAVDSSGESGKWVQVLKRTVFRNELLALCRRSIRRISEKVRRTLSIGSRGPSLRNRKLDSGAVPKQAPRKIGRDGQV